MKIKLGLLIALFALGATGVYACDCFEMPSHRAEFGRSKAVFVGEVLKVETPNKYNGLIEQVPEDLRNQIGDGITLKVIRSWKGDVREQVIWTHATHVLCSKWKFEVGKRYLIYASKFHGILIGAEFCSRTRPLETSDPDELKEFAQLDTFRRSRSYE